MLLLKGSNFHGHIHALGQEFNYSSVDFINSRPQSSQRFFLIDVAVVCSPELNTFNNFIEAFRHHLLRFVAKCFVRIWVRFNHHALHP